MLGQTIQTHREKKNLTQAQLGILIGVGQSTIAMYERGKLAPSSRRLPKLSAALGIEPGELVAALNQTVNA